MRLIATINGVPVYSDKNGPTSITNTTIRFGDGSECDVRTKVVKNRGPGSISLGADDRGGGEGQKKTTKGPIVFSTSSLQLSNLHGDITVEVWDKTGMELTISGPQSEVDSIIAESRGATLFIGSNGSRSGTNFLGNSPDINISGVRISGTSSVVVGNISSSSSNALVSIAVKVPTGTNITLEHISGNTTIGDVKGELDMSLNGIGKVKCGNVGTTKIQNSGIINVEINEVNGAMFVESSGIGGVKVESGNITDLNVRLVSIGGFNFGGVADKATLTTVGIGSIFVKKVKTNLVQTRKGIGKIRVG